MDECTAKRWGDAVMRVKGITDEDFVNYKYPAMYICTSFCDFKCDKENGASCCQNSSLAQQSTTEIDNHKIIERYLSNPITKSICFAGLEPFEQFIEIYTFIRDFRELYHCGDTVVIYTGFNEHEVMPLIDALQEYKNIIVKFGRFIPNQEPHYDEVLGVNLASPNQYAKVIS